MKRSFLIKKNLISKTFLSTIILLFIFLASCNKESYSSIQNIESIEQRSNLVERLVADQDFQKLALISVQSLIDINNQLVRNMTQGESRRTIEIYTQRGVFSRQDSEEMLADFGLANNDYTSLGREVDSHVSTIHHTFPELSEMEDDALSDVLSSAAIQVINIIMEEEDVLSELPDNWITDNWECSLNLPVQNDQTIGCTPTCTAVYEADLGVLNTTASAAVDACVLGAVGGFFSTVSQYLIGGFAIGGVAGASVAGIGAVPGAIGGAKVGMGIGIFIGGIGSYVNVTNCLYNQEQIFNATCNQVKANYYLCCEG